MQLLPTGMVYPIYREEHKEQFEQLLRADRRNAYYTEFLPIDPDKADQDLRDVLTLSLIHIFLPGHRRKNRTPVL